MNGRPGSAPTAVGVTRQEELTHRTDAAAGRNFPAAVYRFRAAEEIERAQAQLGSDDVRRRTVGQATVSFHVARR